MKLKFSILMRCKQKGWSLAALARKAGVPIQTLHGWTEGRKAVNLEHLARVAVVLEISVYELVYGVRDPYEHGSYEAFKELFSGDVRVTIHRIERRLSGRR